MNSLAGFVPLHKVWAVCAGVLVLVCALPAPSQTVLPGTQALTDGGDFATRMVDNINAFLEQDSAHSAEGRASYWNRNFSSRADYEKSIASNRERLRNVIGAVDQRMPVRALELVGTTSSPALIATRKGYKVFAVRWPVLEGVSGEGLLLRPDAAPRARVLAVPDADISPEMLAGVTAGVDAEAQFADRLAASGCMVLIPTLVDRNDTWSGIPGIKYTNQPHREWIYRMAFEVGRHIIGYEVQKVLAGVDWYAQQQDGKRVPIAVAGYGEGGLIAFYSGALDPRIDATFVSGYFGPREELWKEPVYRDVWGLLRQFGDAEIASLIAPRALIIEASVGDASRRLLSSAPSNALRAAADPGGPLPFPLFLKRSCASLPNA